MSTNNSSNPNENHHCPPSRGLNLGWSENEIMALVKGAAIACCDATTGSSMSGTELGRRIRSQFVNSNIKPEGACTLLKTGCELDSRRWDGRSAEGCRKFFDKIKSDCTRFKGCHDRVLKMELTGNPSEDDVLRCAELLCSDGSAATSHMYDCIRNKNYHVSKPFKFLNAYLFLSEKTNILEAGEIKSKEIGEERKEERPVGCKKAKKLMDKQKGSKTRSPESAADAIVKMEGTLEKALEHKAKIARQKLLLDKKRYEFDIAAKLLTPSRTLPNEEKRKIERLLTNDW